MWISDKKFKELAERLHQLEQWKSRHEADVRDGRNFTVYDEAALKQRLEYASFYPMVYYAIPQQDISVKEVVLKIIAKLGMEIVYVEGTPAKAEMQKKKAA